MKPRVLLRLGIVCLALAAVFVATFDIRASRFVAALDSTIGELFAVGTVWLDTVTLREVHQSLLAGILIVAGVFLTLNAQRREWGLALALSGASCYVTHGLASLLKPIFGRLRPWQLKAANDWTDRFFAGGVSFPSGHTAFYFGLFLALAVLAPVKRVTRCVLLLPALFIGVARLLVLAHFPSDVLTSIGISCVIVAGALCARVRFLRSRNTSCAP